MSNSKAAFWRAMRKTLVEIFIAGVSIVICCSAQTSSQHVDRIFTGAKIWTGDDAHPQAQAIAISGDRLLAVGSDQEIKALAASDTTVVDLGGRLVVPGFQDSHLHFPGRSINEIDLHGVETLKDF